MCTSQPTMSQQPSTVDKSETIDVSETIESHTIESHVEDTVDTATMEDPIVDDDEYYAGMIDAQMHVALSKSKQVRVVLTSHDHRVADQLSAKFRPTRITIVKRPQKKDMCTILFLGDDATHILEFASVKCKIRNTLAKNTLMFMQGKGPEDAIASAGLNTEIGTVSLDYACGMFDVRSVVTPPVPATDTTKKKRGNVKLVVPKTEKFVIPELQRVLNGRIKKSSPCRLVYETNDMIKTLKTTLQHHVRAKKPDLMLLE